MQVGLYLKMVKDSETDLAKAFTTVSAHHRQEPDMEASCHLLASWSRQKAESACGFIVRYGSKRDSEADHLYSDLFQGPRRGGLALLRDLHDLWLLATEAQICWTLLGQAAQALRDDELILACRENQATTTRQVAWL